MAKYDDASWHYGGEFPADLPEINGATHIGMFLSWCIHNDLLSEENSEDFQEDIESVKGRVMTGAEFLINNCDGKFIDDDLNELGNSFARSYYKHNTAFTSTNSSFMNDYQQTFEQTYKERNKELKSLYHVDDSWENFELIRQVINQRFKEWKTFVDQQIREE